MARKRREWYAGCSMHIMGKGIRRGAIYKDCYDYTVFFEDRRENTEYHAVSAT